jgi:SpoVK/Ycf46/Vps4 family AAA+-type ATPase
MAKTNQLAQLFRTLADGDTRRARDVACELITAYERRGQRAAAAVLRGALNPNGRPALDELPQLPTSAPSTILASALSLQKGDARLADVRLRPEVGEELNTIIAEWTHRAELAKRGLGRRSKLFFHGPPGCGKSLTALALGNELSLPTFVVRFDAVIGAYLGQTAIHLRELFRFAESSPCLLLFDEIDALGKQRGNPLDVGELDRIVISLMQELEHSLPAGVVVATSNLPEHLDRALWRRFDASLNFPRPGRAELEKFTKEIARRIDTRLPRRVLRDARSANSYFSAERIVEGYARTALLKKIT